ncbi:FmdB family zinc ribbon protein [Rhodococcus sp. KRD162]|uniref:FmdB family zinc ribbon protein n=1 Tax=unclassified Rhodococcus (in: high G+C Gram-positive bacteria) TaxID=192944 RepID=UPI001F49C3E6|nr:FmdB family zinc ribbon protein [Rhodococcus sp. KRD162]
MTLCRNTADRATLEHVPTYSFRCAGRCAPVDQIFPMSDVPSEVPCPECGGAAARKISSPALGRGNSAAMKAHDASRATADAPTVVSSIPHSGRSSSRTTSNPLHRRLPRP